MTVSVCLSVGGHIFETTHTIFTIFLCMLPEGVTRSSSDGVANMLCISGFIDDVIFARKPRLLDVTPN